MKYHITRPSPARAAAFCVSGGDAHFYLELCCRRGIRSARGLVLRADRRFPRQFFCAHGQYGRNGTVNILESKGHKDRIVVLSEDMLELCRNYGQCVETIYPDRKYFFPSPSVRGDGMYSMEWIIPTFRRFLQAAGISGYGEIQPRLYDLRHTFATHRLHQWVKEGKDVNACLAYLSEYMGHSNLESTAYYMRMTASASMKSRHSTAHACAKMPRNECWS